MSRCGWPRRQPEGAGAQGQHEKLRAPGLRAHDVMRYSPSPRSKEMRRTRVRRTATRFIAGTFWRHAAPSFHASGLGDPTSGVNPRRHAAKEVDAVRADQHHGRHPRTAAATHTRTAG
jgi:hypothetical protein